MKRKSCMPIMDRLKGNVYLLLLATCFLGLVSCSSSSSSPAAPAVNAKVNQHLAYQHLLDDNDTLKPHQTVALNLASLADDHLSVGTGSGYHKLPYEITNAGKYKYCIPDEDTHLTQIELFDAAGVLAGSWKKGEVCTAVPLVPGIYSMHVHLDTTDSDPPIFMKPHDVTVTQVGTMKGALKRVASTAGQIPMNQFLNLKVNTLMDVLQRNTAQGLTQGWGVSAPSPFNNGAATYYEFESTEVPYYQLFSVSQLDADVLFYFKPEQGKVSISQGNNRIVLTSCTGDSFCADTVKKYMSSITHAESLGASYDTLLNFSPSGVGFTLSDPNNDPIRFGGASIGLIEGTDWITMTGLGNPPINFNVKARYGTTSGTLYPAMLANEVALFDNSWTSSGFPANTHYWVVNANMKNFTELAFDNPDQRVKTVIAGRGVRAQLFRNPSFQGESAYVSPPVDGELLLTGTDNELLKNGTIGSIRVEPNTNDIPVNEYEYGIVVSANTCIGCDLRGFDLSSISKKHVGGFYGFTGMNFTDSDLSSALFSVNQGQGGSIYNSNFTRTNFTGADLSNNYFAACDFTKTDFTRAVLKNVTFYESVTLFSFFRTCPKLESTDLTSIKDFDGTFFLNYNNNFSDGKYDGRTDIATWWEGGCRASIAKSKVTADLFIDKRRWQFVDAPGVDFSNLNLDGAVFAGVNLTGAKFTNASLKGTVFTKANLTNADLTGADLTGAHLEGATLNGVNLHKVKTLSRANLSGLTLNSPNLGGLDMSGAILKGGSYKNWDGYDFGTFSPTSIIGAYMFNTMLNGADLSGAFLSNVSWFGDKATGENAVMDGTHFETADMPGLKLMQAHLQNANFTNAVLVNADLSTTTLDHSFNGTSFYQTNLKGTNLSGANLAGATLTGAFISTRAGQTFLEVLDDPVTNPNHYKYFQVNYGATTPPGSTDGVITCPDGNPPPAGGCGATTSEQWVSKAKPQDPTGCVSDGQGGLTCDSQRHPK